MEDLREYPRKSVIKSATLFYNSGTCSVPCVVLDWSETGVKIKINTGEFFNCPPTFQLKHSDVGKIYSCRLVWSDDDVFGVEYIA